MSLYILLVDDPDGQSGSIMLITKSLTYAIATARKIGIKLNKDGEPRVATVHKVELDTFMDEGVCNDVVYRVTYPRNLMHPCQLWMWPDKCDGRPEINCVCQSNSESNSSKEPEPYNGYIVDYDDVVVKEALAAANGAASDAWGPPPDMTELGRDHYEKYFHKFMATHFPSIPNWVDAEGFRSFIWTSIYEEDFMFFEDLPTDVLVPELLFPLISNTIKMKSGTRLVPTPSTMDSLFWKTECFRIPEPGPNKRSTFKMFMNTHFAELPEWVKVKEFRSYMWHLYNNLTDPDEDGYVQVPQLFFPTNYGYN